MINDIEGKFTYKKRIINNDEAKFRGIANRVI